MFFPEDSSPKVGQFFTELEQVFNQVYAFLEGLTERQIDAVNKDNINLRRRLGGYSGRNTYFLTVKSGRVRSRAGYPEISIGPEGKRIQLKVIDMKTNSQGEVVGSAKKLIAFATKKHFSIVHWGNEGYAECTGIDSLNMGSRDGYSISHTGSRQFGERPSPGGVTEIAGMMKMLKTFLGKLVKGAKLEGKINFPSFEQAIGIPKMVVQKPPLGRPIR